MLLRLAVMAAAGVAAALACAAGTAAGDPAAGTPRDDGTGGIDWRITGDFNAIGQAHGRFDSPRYTGGSRDGSRDGVLSLTAGHENAHSLVAGLDFGLALGARDELWWRPELVSGIPMSASNGLAAFTNMDTQKFMTVPPTVYTALLFYRHGWELGGKREPVEADATGFARMLAHDRLTLQMGKMDLLSLFDDNTWARKSPDRFLNWCFMTSCAYDFAADARGYAVGAWLEYRGGDWSVRAGRFTLPRIPNQLELDYRLLRHYGDNLEIEHRFADGVLRLLAFRNRMPLATYGAVAGVLAPIPTAADGDNPALPDPRIDRDKTGAGLNGEYSPWPHVGLFARVMFTSADTETNAFTETDYSAAGGMVVEGAAWGRARDAAGAGLAVNAAGGQRRRYLEHWLPSLLMGDGQQASGADWYTGAWTGPTPGAAFHYGREQLAEAWYLLGLGGETHLTLDLQRIVHPAYNRDRGPVDVVSLRIHTGF